MRKEYMKAYAWALKVQKACLFEPVTVHVQTCYCEENHVNGTIIAWTVDISVYSKDGNEMRRAQWCEWEPERFDNQKAEIIEYLTNNGILIK
jgi:hypothetical protein